MTKSDIRGANYKQRKEIKKACLENSKWLLIQAREQFRIGNYNLSTFLAIISYEESLKYGLLNSHESKLLTDKEYNKITSYHIDKLLSKYAFIQLSASGKKIKQKYTVPKKSDYLNKRVTEIKEKRERALYVDFKDSKLNIPTQMNPAHATEEINRAYKSIETETSFERLRRVLKKKFQDIKNQKIVAPTPLNNEVRKK
ncbi:MAG TPA: AbiV family abortive infection protein [Patescibacteria group bacterium]|nr:AbiV family abortive infection protein [Patescibacteria group bacterium]